MSATTVAPPELEMDAPPPAPRRRGRTLAIVGALVLLAGAAAWWFLLGPVGPPPDGEVIEGEIVTLEPLTTTTGTAALHHARVGIAVVLTDQGDPEAIAERTPLLQDALLAAVAERDADTLRSAAGSDELRVELTRHAQRIWSPEEVARIVLVELLVQ